MTPVAGSSIGVSIGCDSPALIRLQVMDMVTFSVLTHYTTLSYTMLLFVHYCNIVFKRIGIIQPNIDF